MGASLESRPMRNGTFGCRRLQRDYQTLVQGYHHARIRGQTNPLVLTKCNSRKSVHNKTDESETDRGWRNKENRKDL